MSDTPASPQWRPGFHFSPRRNWINDPNGLVFFEGEYHLFYQYNPFGERWGHMSWGHAVSRDLFHWEELPVALPEQPDAMIFSGSAVVDWHNTTGFGQDGQPPLVAIYTAAAGDDRSDQCLAYSRDRGRTWTFHDANPVLDLGTKKHGHTRDPKVFWHDGTQHWVMALAHADEHRIGLYASPDLKAWTPLEPFGPAGAVGGVWECPDLFPLPVENEPGAPQRWVLVVSLNPGGPAGGSGCQYFVGNFDGVRFVPDAGSAVPMWADHGPDFYAAVSWSDIPAADGRRILLGWMNNHDYAGAVPTGPWRGVMNVPHALALRRVAPGDGGLRLVQRPVEELCALRGGALARRFDGGSLAQAATWLEEQGPLPALLDVELTLTNLHPHGRCTFDLLTGANAADPHGERTTLTLDAAAAELTVDRTHAGGAECHPKFTGRYAAPIRLTTDGRCTLRLLLDTSSLEVFAQDGETVVSSQIFPSAGPRRLRLASTSDAAEQPAVESIAIHPLHSAWRD